MFCLESVLFGLCYEFSASFRKFINFLLFGSSSEPFAADYFYWFWGNMYSGGLKKLAAAVAGGGAALENQRKKENREKIEYADNQTEEAAQTNEGFQNPTEMSDFHTERRKEWVEENGTVTKAGTKVQAAMEKAGEMWNNYTSGS